MTVVCDLKTSGKEVLIVPLWNWNKSGSWRHVSTVRSNCTFMELKYSKKVKDSLVRLSNCTFMELKFHRTVQGTPRPHRSNCTFMELKLVTKSCLWLCLGVLIVPLWNWNIGEELQHQTVDSSNCTFMELKWRRMKRKTKRLPGSNCTFMELKCTIPDLFPPGRRVLIVPLWNWNLEKLKRKLEKESF